MGKLIVLEGSGDGVGKSTQCLLLKQHLNKNGKQVYFHHFPSYGTFQGSLVEHYLKGEIGQPDTLSPYLINSLYAVDRAITWNNILKNEYDQGKILLLDRYTTSSLIYQTAFMDNIQKKKDFIDYVIDFEYNKLNIKTPDQVIFLHVPFEINNRLRNNRKNNDGVFNDVYERDLVFLKHIYENALFIADYLKWKFVECSKNNQMQTIDEIHQKVYSLVKD